MSVRASRVDAGRLSVRFIGDNPNHHLWNNNGSWWCHYTIHRPDYTKQRRRVSLRIADVCVARQRRDRILGQQEERA